MWIKICGIRDVETARHLAQCGVDAMGLNFYAPSPRAVTLSQAQEIAGAVRGEILPIGLFVNHTVAEIHQAAAACQLTTIQLHGDEPPDFLVELAGFRLIRAFRLGPDGLPPIVDYLHRCDTLGVQLWACLIDAAVPGHYGGSGKTADWHLLATEYLTATNLPLILAGGLNVANVADAIQTVRPWGVDVASGVELSKGIKDRQLVEQFIQASRLAAVPINRN